MLDAFRSAGCFFVDLYTSFRGATDAIFLCLPLLSLEVCDMAPRSVRHQDASEYSSAWGRVVEYCKGEQLVRIRKAVTFSPNNM